MNTAQSTIALEIGLLRKEHGNLLGLDEIERCVGELVAPTTDPTNKITADAVEGLERSLQMAMVASCTCNTKTHEPQHHDERCRYRALCEAAAMLRSLMDRVEELERELEGLGKGRH